MENMQSKTVTNYMGAPNYIVSPLTQLKMLVTSWFLGEPTYYIPSNNNIKNKNIMNRFESKLNINTKELEMLYLVQEFYGNTTDNIFYDTTYKALSNDFDATLKLASQARNEYNMRSGPCAILVIAAIHHNRQEFNKSNPNVFKNYAKQIIRIPTDAWNIFKIWENFNKKQHTDENKKNMKKGFPTILKRCLCNFLEELKPYQMKKYLNHSHIVDLIRICHPKSNKNSFIKEIVETGDIKVNENDLTWERLRSEKKNWKEIIDTLGRIPHMALLRNLRGITTEVNDENYLDKIIIPMLKYGVKGGKQFPFRYMTAYEQTIKLNSNVLINGIKDCIELAMENFPVLEGRTLCLSDNSGSAWKTFTSQYGLQIVAKIANLSSVITAKNCTEGGVVGVFGDELTLIDIDKNKKVLDQVENIHNAGQNVGKSTENGIWIFFKEAFNEAQNLQKDGKEINKQNMYRYFDNIFIESDMQCGYGNLYGKNSYEYKEFSYSNNSYINVLKLIKRYRELVNPKVNIYCVQVAGYNNNLVPEMMYRTHILSGWTGSEVVFAKQMNTIMDEYDKLAGI